MPSSEELFASALVGGDAESIEAWVATGSAAVTRLRDELSRDARVQLPPGSSFKAVLDNLSAIAVATAAAYPETYLRVFSASRWCESPTVCAGLGAIRRPEATERLIQSVGSADKWVRITALAALEGHLHPDLEPALREASDDLDDLVRWHANQRLEEIFGSP